jgi:hypothetical protein
MSRVAAIMMFFAWILYGAMPAIGMPSMPDHSGHQGHEMSVKTSAAERSHGQNQPPCPHGGKICVTPFCAACLTLLPEIAAVDDSPLFYAYPAPASERDHISTKTAPLTPPPRA